MKAVIFDMYETLITLFETEDYFGDRMAFDAGIPEERFEAIWKPAENDKTIGKISLEEILEKILKENDCYSEKMLQKIIEKRIHFKEESFRHLHKEIVPMLCALKERGVLVGLISNCYSEEAQIIRESELFPYFDAVCLSYEEGIKKPDHKIYKRCIDKLHVEAGECLYVGDGGSFELETAREVGMEAVQAVWYLKEGSKQPSGRKEEFRQIESPLALLPLLGTNQEKR